MSVYTVPATPVESPKIAGALPLVNRAPAFQVVTPSKTLNADTVVISDVHLGSKVCRARVLRKALASWYPFRRLVILGDLFDELDFSLLRQNPHHFEVIDDIRELAAQPGVEVDWIEGNHDEHGHSLIERLLGANVHDHMTLDIQDKRYMFMHGHQFDEFLNNHPKISLLAGSIYIAVQTREGNNRRLSRWLKQKSKKWLKVCQRVERLAVEQARKAGADFILCGHTHYYDAALANPDERIRYINTGCWTDYPCTLTAIDRKGLKQYTYM